MCHLLVDVEGAQPSKAKRHFDEVSLIQTFLDTDKHQDFKWIGNVAIDGKVVFCPHYSSEVMILDMVTMALSFVDTGNEDEGKWGWGKWHGAQTCR